jgi:hypothetical protein
LTAVRFTTPSATRRSNSSTQIWGPVTGSELHGWAGNFNTKMAPQSWASE